MIAKTFFPFMASVIIAIVSFGCKSTNPPVAENQSTDPSTLTLNPTRDSTTVLHNPLMGFVKYARGYTDGNWDSPESTTTDVNTTANCNTVYIRVPWVLLEPTEGSYVWKNSQNFKNLIEGVKSKGFRLAFRVIAQDSASTPPYVIDAMKAGGYSKPYSVSQPTRADVTNPVWQAKFKAFILAFGAAFNDPTVTDFIDANGLGLWGEGNLVGIPVPNNDHSQEKAYYDWHLGVYAQAFTKVVLAVTPCTFGSFNNDGAEQKATDLNLPLGKYGCIWRRDGMGQDILKPYVDATVPQLAPFTSTFPSAPMVCEPWSGFASTDRDYMNRLIKDVALYHGMCLTYNAAWAANPDLLSKLVGVMGYRLRPVKIDLPSQVASSGTMKINHVWTNDGVGVLPNGNLRWNNKYAIAYALFNTTSLLPTKVYIDSTANPGVLLKGTNTNYISNIKWSVPVGTYWLAVGIIDQTNPSNPSLDLAMKAVGRRNGWYLLKTISIKAD